MATIRCPCGHSFSDGEIPSPYLSYLIADRDIEALVSAVIEAVRLGEDVETRVGYLMTTAGADVYQCSVCRRLLVFERDSSVGKSFLEETGMTGDRLMQ